MSLLIVAVVLVVLGVAFAMWWMSADQVSARRLKSAPITRISDAADGALVRIVGAVRVMKTATRAPLSGRDCVYYRVKVDERRSGGNNRSTHTVNLLDDTDGQTFLVDDGSGMARVDGADVQAILDADARYQSGFLNAAAPDLDEYLSAFGLSSKGIIFNKNLRYYEGAVEPGETVAVLGTARWQDSDGERQLHLSAPDNGPLIVSDKAQFTR